MEGLALLLGRSAWLQDQAEKCSECCQILREVPLHQTRQVHKVFKLLLSFLYTIIDSSNNINYLCVAISQSHINQVFSARVIEWTTPENDRLDKNRSCATQLAQCPGPITVLCARDAPWKWTTTAPGWTIASAFTITKWANCHHEQRGLWEQLRVHYCFPKVKKSILYSNVHWDTHSYCRRAGNRTVTWKLSLYPI